MKDELTMDCGETPTTETLDMTSKRLKTQPSNDGFINITGEVGQSNE